MKTLCQNIGLAAVLACALVAGCSVDEFANPQRQSAADCTRSGGTLVEGKFCVPDAGASSEPQCTEEGAFELCYDGADQATSLQPPCRAGSRTCHDGMWSGCEQQVLPTDESCNGTDDDCDGRVDEHMDLTPCAVDSLEGVCARGVLLCLAGRNECVQVEHPGDDVCNGEDDDCDGQVDEATARPCYDADSGCQHNDDGSYACVGACSVGEIRCVAGQYATTCEGSVTPEAAERCTSGVDAVAQDEDCDGSVDEGCKCFDGTPCYTGSPLATQHTAPCHAGQQTCSDAMHGMCMDEVKPGLEDCSNPGQDDDCDGVVDNVPHLGESCATESDAQGACKDGAVWQCSAGQRVCVAAPTMPETCNGIDDDCNGRVDESFVLDSDPQNCGACGKKCGPNLMCCSGNCVDITTSNPHCGGCGKACDTGKTCCSSMCFDTVTDVNHCGACDTKCKPILLGATCSASTCKAY